MKKQFYYLVAISAALAVLAGCTKTRTLEKLSNISDNVKTAFTPDRRDNVYEIVFVKLQGSKTYVMKGSNTEHGVVPTLTAPADS